MQAQPQVFFHGKSKSFQNYQTVEAKLHCERDFFKYYVDAPNITPYVLALKSHEAP